jgi:arylsulfate sulfotransferase
MGIVQGRSHNKIFTASFLSLISIAGVFLFVLAATGCSRFPAIFSGPAPKFVEEPAFEMDPNLTTPLAGLLTLSTDIPTQVELAITDGHQKRIVKFSQFSKTHSHPVMGFKPDKSYQIQVSVISRGGIKTAYQKPLETATEPLPDGFPHITTITSKPDQMEPGYTLFDVIPEGSNAEFGALIVIVDAKGEVVWYQTGSRYTDVRQNVAGHLLFLEGGKYVEMDMLGNRLQEWKAMGQSNQKISAFPVATPAFHHEVYPMDNGHFLALSIEERTYDNYPTSDTDPAAPKATARVAGDVVVEFGPDGKIIHQWSLLDILDPYRIGYGSLGKYWDSFFNTETRDWSHGNAVIYDATDDAVIVSTRHLDTIAKFSRKTGQLIWILAPPENWDKNKFGRYLLQPANNTKFFFPYHAHAPMLLPNGHLMVYDNGNYRASPFDRGMPISDSFSRAVEYAIDEQTMEIQLVWQYGQSAPHKYFSAALGDADLLPVKNNVLITHGNVHSAEKKLAARIIEVTHTNPAQEVFHIFITDETADPEAGWRVYRSERITSLYPQPM